MANIVLNNVLILIRGGRVKMPYIEKSQSPIFTSQSFAVSKEIRNFRQGFKDMAKLHFRSYDPNQIVLFPQRINENTPEDSPVRIVSKVVDKLDITAFHKLYHGIGRCAYHPRMMLKVIIYAYMNNIYSCRKIAEALQRDIHFIWLAGREAPDYITINRFRNRVKDEISNIFTQLVLLLAAKGLVSLDVEYVDGTKIESKANKYTFVWRKSVERNKANLMEKIKVLLSQIDDAAAQDKVKSDERVELKPEEITSLSQELNEALSQLPETKDKEEKESEERSKITASIVNNVPIINQIHSAPKPSLMIRKVTSVPVRMDDV